MYTIEKISSQKNVITPQICQIQPTIKSLRKRSNIERQNKITFGIQII